MSREQDRQFFRNFILVIGGLITATIVLIAIATLAVVGGGEGEARQQLLAERAARHLEPVGSVRLTGEPMPGSMGGQEQASGQSQEPRSGGEVFNQVCSACHKSGVMNAPVAGNKSAWSERIDKGLSTLVDHSANGFNNMPPQKGQASEEEIRKAIVWMVEESGLSISQ